MAICLVACERDPPREAPAPDGPPVQTHDLTELGAQDDIDDLTSVTGHPTVELHTGATRRFSACHEIFEDDGQVLPLDEDLEFGMAVFGCDADEVIEFDDGRRAIAYEIPIDDEERATDLRFVLYDEDGEPGFDHRVDRSHASETFAATYRGSFLRAIDDRFLCAGTRWGQSLQVLCADVDTGRVIYDGQMAFWAGVLPIGHDGSLFSADEEGITRRYPYSGTEMRHREFDERGGRMAFYAADDRQIFFAPEEQPLLTAWDIESLRPNWHAELPATPHTRFYRTSDTHRLLVFRIGELIVGVDSDDGALRMVFEVGDDPPQIAWSDDEMYVMVRRPGDDPLLFALDPDDGQLLWASIAPAGTLHIDYRDGRLLTRTVRTVRPVQPASEPTDE